MNEKLRILLCIAAIILGSILLTISIMGEIQRREINLLLDQTHCPMYNTSYIVHAFSNGIYYTDKYYCVWVANRTSEEIKATEQHEICHHLIAQDRVHFCS